MEEARISSATNKGRRLEPLAFCGFLRYHLRHMHDWAAPQGDRLAGGRECG